MSDEEYSESEEEETQPEPQKKPERRQSEKAEGGDPEFVKRKEAQTSALDEQLKEYIAEWRKQRAREEEDLKKLKEKQAKRKVARAEEEKRLAEKKKTEEERRVREAEEKKQREIEEKRRRLEEAEKKRQAMMAALKDQSKSKGPNFVVNKKADTLGMSSAQIERNKTKEQLEEEKRISLSIRIKPLAIENMSIDRLRLKAQELWEAIVKLETEKYDLEERQKRQDYDLKELKERQKQQLRHKALKKGLDPEALTGKYPPKIQVASKYERRVDTRSYDDKKKLFEGGWETLSSEELEKVWKTRYELFTKRKRAKLPKWLGERPGKKKDAPESPEEEEVKVDEEPEAEPVFTLDDEEEEEPPRLFEFQSVTRTSPSKQFTFADKT
ncbi:Troponin T [Nesidiocoris tenuis]|uniref:Troponin T n=1 Tax=Nesidiocoris tenuis TaxID=355587 RepID=A0ABN7AHH5_9HEMI|nr:Troponin T [Nesidiocoris tenuis]